MTLDFAKKEAARRTDVLKTTHYVIKPVMSDGYIVTARVPLGYKPVATYLGIDGVTPIARNAELCNACGAILPSDTPICDHCGYDPERAAEDAVREHFQD